LPKGRKKTKKKHKPSFQSWNGAFQSNTLFQEIALLPALSTSYSASNIFRPSHYIHRIALRYLRAAYSKQPAESALS
jgi:hypothetical protein